MVPCSMSPAVATGELQDLRTPPGCSRARAVAARTKAFRRRQRATRVRCDLWCRAQPHAPPLALPRLPSSLQLEHAPPRRELGQPRYADTLPQPAQGQGKQREQEEPNVIKAKWEFSDHSESYEQTAPAVLDETSSTRDTDADAAEDLPPSERQAGFETLQEQHAAVALPAHGAGADPPKAHPITQSLVRMRATSKPSSSSKVTQRDLPRCKRLQSICLTTGTSMEAAEELYHLGKLRNTDPRLCQRMDCLQEKIVETKTCCYKHHVMGVAIATLQDYTCMFCEKMLRRSGILGPDLPVAACRPCGAWACEGCVQRPLGSPSASVPSGAGQTGNSATHFDKVDASKAVDTALSGTGGRTDDLLPPRPWGASSRAAWAQPPHETADWPGRTGLPLAA